MRILALVAVALLSPRLSGAAPSASDLISQAMEECHAGRAASDRAVRKERFERGETLANRAVSLDDGNPEAHFAIVCNLGELLRLDGEKITSVFGLRRLLKEIDRTLELDPSHLNAMATKGNLLMRLPRVLGGDEPEGERLLREVVRRDPQAITSRITLARSCGERGNRQEAVELASRALEIAKAQGKPDKAAEAQAALDQLGAAR